MLLPAPVSVEDGWKQEKSNFQVHCQRVFSIVKFVKFHDPSCWNGLFDECNVQWNPINFKHVNDSDFHVTHCAFWRESLRSSLFFGSLKLCRSSAHTQNWARVVAATADDDCERRERKNCKSIHLEKLSLSLLVCCSLLCCFMSRSLLANSLDNFILFS